MDRTLVMGIINVSPDSFSGDGLGDTAGAVDQARAFLRAGADILDIGAMSTRPGATIIAETTEAERLHRVISAIRPLTEKPISADTFRTDPARAALDAGADILNDIAGLRDARIAQLAASYGAGVVVMHMQGTPVTMQRDPHYDDVVTEVYDALATGVKTARGAGVSKQSIIVDPGIGFGKTLDHNIELLHRLPQFTHLGHPLLVGTSRKGFIGRITGRDVEQRMAGTAATVALAIAGGADIVRVHDVEQMVDVCRVSDRIVRWTPLADNHTRP
jgi:dihydropteroate synthase